MNRFLLAFFILFLSGFRSYAQDLDFAIKHTYLQGKKIIKIHKDLHDPYLWALGEANDVYRINTATEVFEDWSANFSGFGALKLIDIAGADKDHVYVATASKVVIAYQNGIVSDIGKTGNGLQGTVNSIGMGGTRQVFIGTDKEIYTYTIAADRLETINEGPGTLLYEAVYRKTMYARTFEPKKGYTNISTITSSILGYNIPNIFSGDSFGEPVSSATFTNNNISVVSSPSMDVFWGSKVGLFQMKNADDKMNPQNQYRFFNIPGVNKVTDIIGYAAFGLPTAKANLLVASDKGFFWSSSYLANVSNTQLVAMAFPTSANNGLITDAVYDIEINADLMIEKTYVACEDLVWLATSVGVYQLKPQYAIPPPAAEGIHFKGLQASEKEQFICTGAVTIVAEPSATANLQIRWFKDGVMIPGAETAELQVTETGDYSSEWYATCENIRIKTNVLTVTEAKNPLYTLSYAGFNIIKSCEGTEVKLAALGTATYQYKWYKNGQLVPDSTKKSFTVTSSGKYTVDVGSCGSWHSNPEVEVTISPVPEAIIKSSKPAYCAGEEGTLTLNLPLDPSYIINWYRDGNLLTEMENKTELKTTIAGDYTVQIKMLTGQSTNCTRLSRALKVEFQEFPTGVIDQIAKNSLCEGQAVTLRASYTAGTVIWSTGETGTEITVTKSGKYTAKLKSTGGCEGEISTDVILKPAPVFTVADVTICPEDKQPVKIIAPPGFVKYTWNGVSSTKSDFMASAAGTVTLIVEDQNGCTATRQIKVLTQCLSLKPFSVFTPNGDGINDVWGISGIENYPDSHVQVFNRNGVRVFESKGVYASWNGTIKGQKLPAGVYYYTISTKNSIRTFSGSVSIFY